MYRQIILFFLSLILLGSCRNHEEKICNELDQIAKAVAIHTKEPVTSLQMSNILIPRRYHKMYVLHRDLEKKITYLEHLLDSLIKNNKAIFTKQDISQFKQFYALIDSIYLPRLDTVKSEANKYTQLTSLNLYLEPLKEKINHISSNCDLELAKLYLMLIDREVIAFIHEEAKDYTVPINFIKPVTIKEGNTLKCYLAAVDTCNYPYILIGKFEHLKMNEGKVFYKKLYVHDTVFFSQEKAILDLSKIQGYEAVIYFIGPQGEPIQFQIQ
jgi:hypothetical protein